MTAVLFYPCLIRQFYERWRTCVLSISLFSQNHVLDLRFLHLTGCCIPDLCTCCEVTSYGKLFKISISAVNQYISPPIMEPEDLVTMFTRCSDWYVMSYESDESTLHSVTFFMFHVCDRLQSTLERAGVFSSDFPSILCCILYNSHRRYADRTYRLPATFDVYVSLWKWNAK